MYNGWVFKRWVYWTYNIQTIIITEVLSLYTIIDVDQQTKERCKYYIRAHRSVLIEVNCLNFFPLNVELDLLIFFYVRTNIKFFNVTYLESFSYYLLWTEFNVIFISISFVLLIYFDINVNTVLSYALYNYFFLTIRVEL